MKILGFVLRLLVLLLLVLFYIVVCTYDTNAQARTAVIDGVEYRLFTADEMRDLLVKLKERELLLADNKELVNQNKELDKLYREVLDNKDKELSLVREKLGNERDYWKSQFEAERQNTLRLEAIFKSCTGRVLWLFRICRL